MTDRPLDNVSLDETSDDLDEVDNLDAHIHHEPSSTSPTTNANQSQQQPSLQPELPPPRGQIATLSQSANAPKLYIVGPSPLSPAVTSLSSSLSSITTPPVPKLLVLLTNSRGLASPHNLRLADRFADRLGCLVVIPDLLDGDAVTSTAESASDLATSSKHHNHHNTPANKESHDSATSLLSRFKMAAVSLASSFMHDMWVAKHSTERTLPLLRAHMLDLITVYRPARVAVVGYSFGGKYALHAAAPPPGFQDGAWAADEVDTIVCAAAVHPSLLEGAPGSSTKVNGDGDDSGAQFDFGRIRKPVLLVYSKNDDLLPAPVVAKALRVLNENNVPVETAVYDNEDERNAHLDDEEVPPLPHGFAVPGDYPESVVGDRPESVFNLVATWVGEHL
ncbi:uncharacterized protein SAPINGB_P000123 [Magnusiomyces paraingens]|uniref:Dienelactone hydrolase domain-containing protein n=1 Tax=Magnusiomyces paraingens TaxID=2606893 RepID=A0A5E8AYB1_9ASCO|nr:uncharacterized protein SAPINGB_P000123 [Saprochaete ingens]VVT43738.1 unnamed protein product [Saprochaete ingens]